MYYPFAENLKYYREKRGFTQKQLADMLGVSNVTICYWETSVVYPRIDRIYDIARVLGIDPLLLVDTNNQWII